MVLTLQRKLRAEYSLSRISCAEIKMILRNKTLYHDDATKWKQFSALLALCEGNSPVTD